MFKYIIYIFIACVYLSNESQCKLTVVEPSEQDTVFIGDTLRISWIGANGEPVKIEYSDDYGKNWKFIADGITDDFYKWIVPFIEVPTILFRATTGYIKLPFVYWNIKNAHGNRVLSVEYSKDGNYVVSCGEDKKVKIWDIAGRRAVDSIELSGSSKLSEAHFINKIDSVIIAADNTVILWDRVNSRIMDIFGGKSSFSKTVYSISSHPNESLIAAGAWDGTIVIYNYNTNQIIFNANSDNNKEIYTVGFSADGADIIYGDYSGKIYMQDWRNSSSAITLAGHSENYKGRGTVVYAAKEFPNGMLLASCGVDYTVRIWDLTTEAELYKLEGHKFHNRTISISNDGKRVLSGSLDSTLRQWDIERGREINVAVSHAGQILRAEYSPTADSMVSCGRDSSIKFWRNYEYIDEGDTITRVLKYKTYVRIPHLTAFIGERIGVPVEYIGDESNLPQFQGRIFDADIYIEVPNMLLNTILPSNYKKSGTRKDTIIYHAKDISFNKDTIAVLETIALLGDVRSEEIRIIDFKILNDSLFTIEKVDGSITVLPYCIGENQRMIAFSKGWTSVTVAPNPTKDEIEVKLYLLEDGYYNLEIFNNYGMSVMNVFKNYFKNGLYIMNLDISQLGSGAYIIKLNGPTKQASSKFLIIE